MKSIGAGFYVIPSSIHELLLIKKDVAVDAHDILEIIREVNKTVVAEEDYLSDNLYDVNEDGTIRIAV